MYGMVEKFTCNSTSTTLHASGCIDAFGDFLKEHAYTLGSVGLGFAVIQVIIYYFCIEDASNLI